MTHPDPFKIDGPTCISFSGGRTSGYMLSRIIQAHGGSLPSDVVVCFANTGKEREETLRFVQDCAERFAVPIVWLEFVSRAKSGFKVVSFESAARNGEPFDRLIDNAVATQTYFHPRANSMSLRIVPITLSDANEFVRRLHRHSRPVVGHRFSVAVEAKTRVLDGPEWVLAGVAIVGRPVAPRLDDGKAAEITRVCTDGTRNACSMLYGAARRAAKALGYSPIYTYTLPDEGGASLRAAGFTLDKEDAGGPAAQWHNRPGRTVQSVGDDLFGGKWRWVG